MRYRELFRIEIGHPYFSEEQETAVTLIPLEATRRRIHGHGGIIKPLSNGISVFIPVDGNNLAENPFRLGDSLVFEAFPCSNTFSLVTDSSGLLKGEIHLFSNTGSTGTEPQLLASTLEENNARNGFPMVAKIEIQLTNDLIFSTETVVYQCPFQVKSANWKYYLVADSDTTDLVVEDRGASLIFNRQVIDAQTTDQLGESLRTNYPNANLFRFESAQPIPYAREAIKNLQLLRDGHVLIQHLPNPDLAANAVKIIKILR